MAFILVTYTFSNGSTADATQVNQNFTDVINGTSDGTKDFNIAALTTAGTATLNGNMVIGASSTQTLTINASLASTVIPDANNSRNLGSATLGFASIYLGSAGGFTTRLVGAATSSYTITFPTTAGTDGFFLKNNGSASTQWAPLQGTFINYGLSTSVGASALTIALKGADGNDPSSSNKVTFDFRNATATTGTPSFGSATAATSVTISSGSTLGHVSAVAEYIYVYAINNAGVVELAVSTDPIWEEASVQTTIAEGGAGAADSRSVLYSTNARVGVGVRLIGRLQSTQATAGTWASNMSEISLPSSFRITTRNEIHLTGGNGFGSTSNKIRRFTTTESTLGSDMTYADSATAGMTVTINKSGIYHISRIDSSSGNSGFGISKNSSQLTTAIGSITSANRLVLADTTGSGNGTALAIVTNLYAGDVIRAHDDGTADGTSDARVHFRITKLNA